MKAFKFVNALEIKKKKILSKFEGKNINQEEPSIIQQYRLF